MFEPILFVSLGPGDPELITLKGLKALQSADIIFSPSTAKSKSKNSSRAMDILLELGIDEKKIELFDVPMSKDRSKALISYKNVASEVAEQYKLGKRVAVTAEGDAGFYSTIYYISEHLKEANIPLKRIAGIPAFIASGTLADLHIVRLEEELNVIPGIVTKDKLIEKIEEGFSIVIMKPSLCELAIKEAMSAVKDVDFHYFENVGVEDKEFYTLDRAEIVDRKFPYFSLLIIRK